MAKLTLTSITSGFASVAQLNANFTALTTELQDKILYRDNPTGEPNTMENDLDMNSNDILNAQSINTDTLVVDGTSLIAGSATSVPSATAVPYSNTTSGLAASNVQAAIDEVDADLDAVEAIQATRGNSYTLDTGVDPGDLTLNNILLYADKGSWPTIANGTDIDHDIDFSAGGIVDTKSSLKGTIIVNPSILVKQLDATWAVGTNAGGLFTGTIAADTTYHCFLIVKDSDGSIDAGFDTSPIAANIPTGYTSFRRMGFRFTDSGSDLTPFTQSGDYFSELTRLVTLNATTISTVGALETAVPSTGLNTVIGKFTQRLTASAATQTWLRASDEVNDAPTTANSDMYADGTAVFAATYKDVRLDTAGQLRYRSNRASVTAFSIDFIGYIDPREE